jgi:hypothetical protein
MSSESKIITIVGVSIFAIIGFIGFFMIAGWWSLLVLIFLAANAYMGWKDE